MTVAISLERYFAVHHPIGKLNLMFVDVAEVIWHDRYNKDLQILKENK